LINDKDIQKEANFACKFCPFANECSDSDRIPAIFYELTNKGKSILKNNKEVKKSYAQ
jgi:hypothetical protein